MSNFWMQIKNKAWRLKEGKGPDFENYHLKERPDLDSLPSGRMAELFFSNSDETVNKWIHYLPIYDRILGRYQNTDLKFLEIGVFKGGSMRLWRNFFGEEATIFGVDIDPSCKMYDGKSGQVRIGSQGDPDFLSGVVEEMGGVDVVLDDGSHISAHQRISYETLFPLLSDGGLYLIEDMHTAYWPSYEGGLRRRGTAVEFLKDQIDSMHAHYRDQSKNTAASILPIGSIQFFDSIAVVEKQAQEARKFVMVPPIE